MINMELTEEQKEIILPLLNSYYYEAENYTNIFRDFAERCYGYYHGRYPIYGHDSVIPLTHRVCKQQTEGALKDLVEVFLSSNHEPLQFVPETPDEDPALSVAATKLVRQVYTDNDGDDLFYSALKESLIVGSAFIKRHYITKRETITTQAKNLKDESEAQGMILAWREGGLKIDNADIELTENEDGTLDLVATYEGEFEHVDLSLMPIDEIVFDQQARSIKDLTYFCHRVKKSKSELIDLGFSEEDVSNMNIDDNTTTDYYNVNASRSNYMRFEDQDIGADTNDKAVKVWVKEHYIRTNLLESNKTPTLYKILECCGKIASCEIVYEIPVSVFTPTPTPNQIIGESLVDYVSDIQDKLTWLQRDALKHSQMTANPRYIVQGDLVDKRSLMMNEPGSVIDVQQMGVIEPLLPQPMDQGVSVLLQIAMDEAQSRTGITDTQQGDIGNALETGRMSEASVESMLALARGKVRLMARNLAYGGIQDLFKAVYRLIRENGSKPVSVLTAGGVIQINPSMLPDKRFVRVDVAMTSEEKAKSAASLLQLVQFSQMIDPQGEFIQPQNKAFMLYQMAEKLGFPNYHDYFIPIEAYQPQQPGIADQLQVAKAQAEIEYTQSQSKALVQKAHNETEAGVIAGQIAADETHRKDMELTFTMQKAADETHLANSRLEMERDRDVLRYQQHSEKHQVDEFRANTDNLKVQSNIMLQSRKQAFEANPQP